MRYSFLKHLLVLAIIIALLLPAPVQAGGTRTCRTIPHGRICYVNGQRVSVSCHVGYHLSPSWGTRCVRDK